MRTSLVRAAILAALAVAPVAVPAAQTGGAAAAPAPAVSAVQSGADSRPTLAAALEDIAAPAGIRFRIDPALARDRVTPPPTAATAWPEVVRELLRGYNWAGTWDGKGRLTAVSVSGRNGDGTAPPAGTAAPDHALFRYKPAGEKLPARYLGYGADAVHAIAVPAERLRGMKKGARVTVSLPDGRYQLVHDNLWKHPNGDLTWVGYVDGAAGLYRATLTLGEDGVEGQIRTPGGLYQLESEDGGDWLVDVAAAGLQPVALDHDGIVPMIGPLPRSAPASEAASQKVMPGAPSSRPTNASFDASGRVVLDVALLYTKGLGARQVLTRLNDLLANANQALADSQANLVLRQVVAKKVGYPAGGDNDAALDALTDGVHGFEGVAALRGKFGADLVLLVRPFRPGSQGGNCGTAWVNGSGGTALEADLAFAVIGVGSSGYLYCSKYTLAHETGHILGATHDRAHASVPGRYEYSYGYTYGPQNLSGDIMSYNRYEIGLYATPALDQCDDGPCGVPAGQTGAADVVRTFNNTAAQVSAFRKAADSP